MYCRNCGENLTDDSNFCPECGEPAEPAREVSRPQSRGRQRVEPGPADTTPGQDKRRRYKLVSVASSTVGIFLLPVVLGPVGIYFGYKLRENYDEQTGTYLMLYGLAATVLGIVVGLIVTSSVS